MFTAAAASTPDGQHRKKGSTAGLSPSGDSESEQRLQQVLELLLTGGYFRARVTGLSAFDKILGGLAWAISSSNADIDLDVFSDSATMGQKLKLGESVVAALVRMKCPFALQTHQIKFLDLPAIFPVVQWLVKKVIETREGSASETRFADYEFRKGAPAAAAAQGAASRAAVAFSEDVRSRFKVQRKFRRHRGTAATAQRTLLEYCAGTFAEQGGSGDGSARKDDESATAGGDAGSEMMASVQGEEHGRAKKVAGSVVGSFMARDDISQAARKYASESSQQKAGTDEEAAPQSGEEYEERMLAQQLNAVAKEIEKAKAALAEAQAKHDERERAVAEAEAKVGKRVALARKIEMGLEKLAAAETPENARVLAELRALVALNESIKAQEAAFKANCKAHMQRLKDEIERRKQGTYGVSDFDRVEEINAAHARNSERLAKLRQLRAKKARDVAKAERLLDDIPSRPELAQYQRMFVELYGQVQTKLVETRRYVCTFNRLEDTRLCLAKEVELVESVAKGYEVSVKSKAAEDKFLESMGAVVRQVQQNLQKKTDDASKEKEKLSRLTEAMQSLVEQERAFTKATKDFQDECRRNEQLEASIAKLSPPSS